MENNKKVVPPRVESVVQSEVLEKKKTMKDKFKEVFIKDTGTTMKTKVVNDVLIPVIQDMLMNGLKRTMHSIESTLRGTANPYRPTNNQYHNPTTQNSQPYRPQDRQANYQVSNGGPQFTLFTYREYEEAERVLSALRDYISMYGFASIQTYYDYTGRTSNNGVHVDWGWTDLSQAIIIATNDGRWCIELPVVTHRHYNTRR